MKEERGNGGGSSQILLDLENNTAPSRESPLLVCKNDGFLLPKSKKTDLPVTKPEISSVPKSQVLGKVRDFLGVMSEANRQLQLDATDKSKDYNIEELTGEESEYIEMDLMLGVADLHTPEAVAAAESAMSGYQPVISLEADDSSSDDDSDDDDDDEDEDHSINDHNCSPTNSSSKPPESKAPEDVLKKPKRKRQKIVELS